MKIERFEDVQAWQKARVLAKMVYDAVKSNKNFGSDYKLDQGYINQEKFSELYFKSDEVARLLSGFIQYLLNKDKTQQTQETGEVVGKRG